MNSVDMGTGDIFNVQIKRAKVLEQFADHASCVVVIEACGGAHRWARTLSTLGHTVRLLHAKIVRTFVSGNKTDATDARAIWLSVQQPGVKFVRTKMSAQEATLTLTLDRQCRHTHLKGARGTQDPVVSVARGEDSRDALAALGHPVQWHTYPMPHSLHPQEIKDISRFLQSVLPA